MNPLPIKMLRAFAGAAVLMAAAGAARADAFAQAILVIDNFRLQHANGTPYTASDFSLLAGTVDARATGQLNGVFAVDAQSASFGSGISLDIAHQNVGAGLQARPENNFAPYPGLPGAAGSYGYADQRMTGNMITTTMGAAGALFQTRADASLAANGMASGNSGIGSSTSFSFSLGVGEYMTIAFDALAFTQAYANGGAAGPTSANARLAWSISVIDLSTGATVFAFEPAQLNGLSNVSRTGAADGASTYEPGWMSFGAATDMLVPGDIYQFTIAQSSLSEALQSHNIPEPGTLAIFGAALLAMGVLDRRRRARGAGRA